MTSELVFLSSNNVEFPHPNAALAEPDGLLAVGGDLSYQRLVAAYSNGIFPWFNEGEPILWWSPSERAIIEPQAVHISKSLAKFIRKRPFTIKINTCFDDVIHACQQTRLTSGTWITEDMIAAYCELHHRGKAHSIEVFDGDSLVGGLYGVMVGAVFCGESMFHVKDNASKVAFWALCKHLSRAHCPLIDCQLENPYLKTFAVETVSRSQYLAKLKELADITMPRDLWQSGILEDIYD